MRAARTWAERNPYKFAKPIIEFIASNDQIEGTRNELKTTLAEVIRKRFGESFDWRREIHPLLVGRVFERAGLFRETLPYYELVAASHLLSEEVRSLAWQRWARTKWLQSLRERELKAAGRAEKAYKEALERAEGCGFRTPEVIPEELPSPLPGVEPNVAEPSLEPVEPREESPRNRAPVQKHLASDRDFSRKLQIGAVEVRVSPDGTRVNIMHSETLEQASLSVSKMRVHFEGEEIEIDSDRRARLSEWELDLDLSSLAAGKVIVHTSDGLDLAVPVAVIESDPTAR